MIAFWKTKQFERLAPLGFAIMSLVSIIVFRLDIVTKFGPNGWDASNLYSAVFNWASIQSGFVFGIYGFIATKRDGFAGVVAKAGSFDDFLRYARRAYLTGFALTFVSLPIMVADVDVASATAREFSVLAAWFAAFVWTFCAFLRVAFIFGIIAATPDRPAEILG